eukprot:scaffold13228_cov45-Cyclotella_meneghiniana.AAC.3
MTCLPYPHNPVDRPHVTTGASSPPLGILQKDTSRRRAISSGGLIVDAAPISPQIPIHGKYSKNEGNLRGNGCSGRGRPSRANLRIWHSSNGIGEWPMKLWWSDVSSRTLTLTFTLTLTIDNCGRRHCPGVSDN